MVPDDPSRWVVGVDLGGTNIRAAGVDASGTMLELVTERVDYSGAHAPGSFGQLVEVVARLCAARPAPPAAIALGATGPVHRASGTIDNPYTLPPAMQGPVRAVLDAAFGVPVTLENDADAAAVGEAWLGAGREAGTVVTLTVGTGIGVGVVRAGRIVRGGADAHGEAGHMVVDPAGPPCYCGANGCLESLASGWAVAARAREARLIADGRDAADIHRLAQTGEPEAAAIVAVARRALVHGAWNLAAMHAPDMLILTGSALGEPAIVRDLVSARLGAFTMGRPAGVAVRGAELGGLAGVLGAARLGFDA